jgi:hypothetical protein
MSLINEALKKAQQARHHGAAAEATPGVVERRDQPPSARTTLLIAAGAVVLVVIAMVLTALWITRSPKNATVAVTAPPPSAPVTPQPTVKDAAPKPVVISLPTLSTPPPITVPVEKPAATPSPTPATITSTTPVKLPATASTSSSASAPTVASSPVPAPAPAELDPKQVERIHQFVEAVRVTGIRASGTESKVLMNDRVYRVNDIVDRTLGLRLTKVGTDSLTFTDTSGATYVKYF